MILSEVGVVVMGKGFSGYYNSSTNGNKTDAILLSNKSNGFTSRKDKRHGSKDRQQQGNRERNVGHPNGEEHSRNAKGNRGPKVKRSDVVKNVGKGLVVTGGTAAVGYVAYRGLRMLPSLVPALWWTIPANIAIP